MCGSSKARGHTCESTGCQVGALALLMPSCSGFKDTHKFKGMLDLASNNIKRLKTGKHKVTSSFSVQEEGAEAVKGVCGFYSV